MEGTAPARALYKRVAIHLVDGLYFEMYTKLCQNFSFFQEKLERVLFKGTLSNFQAGLMFKENKPGLGEKTYT